MPKNNVLHARITDELHEKITEECNMLGCSITDYITSVLDASFDDPSSIELEPMPRTEAIVKKVSYDDGKTWIDIPELTNVTVLD